MLQQLHPQRTPVNLEQEFRLSFYFPLNYSFFKITQILTALLQCQRIFYQLFLLFGV